MNKAPQRPHYDEHRIPPRRPPRKQKKTAALLAVLIVAAVILIAVIIAVAVKHSDNDEPVSEADTSAAAVTTEEADDTVSALQNASSASEETVYHILLDPGHGFDDNGCTSDYLYGKYEQNITLSVAECLAAALEERGYRVSFTHDGETYPDEQELISQLDALELDYTPEKIVDNNIFNAYERTMYANILNCSDPVDAFISLHVNSNEDSAALSDFTLDYCADNDSTAASGELVDCVLSSLESAFPEREQRRYADDWDDAYMVTKYSYMPSFLIEMGYATTPSDAENLTDPAWQKQLAEAIADGIDAYFTSED